MIPTNWQAQAACTRSPDTMFPGQRDTRGIAAAREICAGCLVPVACLTATMRIENGGKTKRHGVAAATTPGQRVALHKRITESGEPLEDAAADEVNRLLGGRQTLRQAFEAHARHVGGGHVLWESRRRQIRVHGRNGPSYLPRSASFLLGYGRPFDGQLKVECEVPKCIAWQHLSDTRMRKARQRRRPTADLSRNDQLQAAA